MHEITRNMIPVRSGVHGGDWIACDVVSPGMGGRCIFSIPKPCKSNKQTKTVPLPQFIMKEIRVSSFAYIYKPLGHLRSWILNVLEDSRS